VQRLLAATKSPDNIVAKSTLFTPIARIEVVQALSEFARRFTDWSGLIQPVIMAAWGDMSWRPAGHALRIA
jgi:hypothetical protein